MSQGSSQCLVSGLLIVERTYGKVTQATPSCRVLGSGTKPQADLGGVPRAFGSGDGRACAFQGIESNNRLYSVAIPSSLATSVVIMAQTLLVDEPICGGGACPPLHSEITAVVCPCYL